uniref:Insulin-like domain-containing protein n=1 Tax=Cacopsylla melanoneura TaxID=428564 RepID=A0A8D8TEJ3_9HEMI
MTKGLPQKVFLCIVLYALLTLTSGNPPPSMLSHKSTKIRACGSDLTRKLHLECARHQNKAGKRNYETDNKLEDVRDYNNKDMDEIQDPLTLLQSIDLSEGEEVTSKDLDYLIYYYSPRYIRLRRSYYNSRGGGIVTECCHQACTLDTLLDYCP